MRKPKNIKEQLEKIKYYSRYNYVNEAHIREADDEEYDEIPKELLEDEAEGGDDVNLDDVPNPEEGGEEDLDFGGETEEEPSPEKANINIDEPIEEPIQSKDELQTQALRAQIEAMQKMSEKIDSLETTIKMMNGKVTELDADVEQVKEPEPIEKFNQRKQDSHPFYYGLNDMWNGNVFQSKREELGEKGIVKLEDGSYIADFDDLPQYSSHEIKSSF